MAIRKWYGLVYVDANGVREPEFVLIDTEDGCAEYANTYDPRGVLEAFGDEEPGPEDLPRYEIVPLTEAEADAIEKAEAEIAEDEAVADYETWSERRMGL